MQQQPRDYFLETLALIKELLIFSEKKYNSTIHLTILASYTLKSQNESITYHSIQRWINSIFNIVAEPSGYDFNFSFHSVNGQPDPAGFKVNYTITSTGIDLTNMFFTAIAE